MFTLLSTYQQVVNAALGATVESAALVNVLAKPAYLPATLDTCTCTNDGKKLTSPPIDLTEQTTSIYLNQEKWKICCGIHLTQEDKNILLSSDEWLNDNIVNASQFMLKQQHPVVGGLQSTTLAKSFAMEPQTGEFVQILNINDNHWIAVSTIGCQPSTINVYDSLHGYLPKHEQKVVADIMMSPYPTIQVNYIGMQWQSGISDCGLFALAFTTALCSGQDPATLNFDQSRMRRHVLSCIQSGCVTPFPTWGIRRAHGASVVPTKTKIQVDSCLLCVPIDRRRHTNDSVWCL